MYHEYVADFHLVKIWIPFEKNGAFQIKIELRIFISLSEPLHPLNLCIFFSLTLQRRLKMK